MGFTLPARVAVAAVRSYRTFSPLPPPSRCPCAEAPRHRASGGGTFSVALSVKPACERAPPAVSRHAALWRPDFPPAPARLSPYLRQRLPVRETRPHCTAVPAHDPSSHLMCYSVLHRQTQITERT